MAHHPPNRRTLVVHGPLPSKPTTGKPPSTTPTVYNLTNHFSKLHPNPKPTKPQNPPTHKHVHAHLQPKPLSKSLDLEPSTKKKMEKQAGKRIVLEKDKNKSMVIDRTEIEEDEVIKPTTETKMVGRAMGRRRSFCDAQVELGNFLVTNCAKVVSADMRPLMQIHAVGFARKIKDSLEKFTSKSLALSLKKEFDGAYGPAWHCIVGTSFGSFVTHSVGGFLYFALDQKFYILLFKTSVQKAD